MISLAVIPTIGTAPAVGGGGAAASAVLVFDNAAARDTFFGTTSNLALLFTGLTTILLRDGGTGTPVEQIWAGADQPTTYDNTQWISRSSAGFSDAATIKTLYESNANTNAFTDPFLAVLQQLRFENNRIISNVTIETPPGSIAIGPATLLSTALRTINFRSDVTNSRAFVLTQEYDETSGLATATVYSGGAMTQVPINDPPGTDTSNTAAFSLTATADEIITQFSVETNQISATIPFTLTGRTGSDSGPIAFEFSGDATTDASGIATINLIQDFNPLIVDNGDQVFLSATATGLVGIQAGPVFTPNTTINRIVIERKRVALFEELPPAQVQSDFNETDTGSAAFILNKPTIPTPRTDEQIQDLMASTLRPGTNIASIVYDDPAGTITINATGGTTPTPGPGPNDFRYGLSQQSDPALVVFAGLTDVATPTDPQTVTTGTTTAGDYFHIFSANTHPIITITDDVLQQVVYQDGGTGNIFTKVSDARTESGTTYDAYSVGPLNAGVDENYTVRFS